MGKNGGSQEDDQNPEPLDPRLQQAVESDAGRFFDGMLDEGSELHKATERRHAAMESACAELLPQLVDRSPQAAYQWVQEQTDDVGLAMMVRERLWVQQLGRANDDHFEEMATEIQALSPRTVGLDRLFAALDDERNRRGLPPSPSKQARDEEEAAAWRRAADSLKADPTTVNNALERLSREREPQIGDQLRPHDTISPVRLASSIFLVLPMLLLGYAAAAFLTVVPIYLVIAALGDSYTLIPDTDKELITGAVIMAALTGWYFISGIRKALASRGRR